MKLLHCLFVGLSLSICGLAFATEPPGLRTELEAMLDADQTLRQQIREIETTAGPESREAQLLWDRQSELDQANITRLLEIIETHEWPRASEVGEKGALAAFLVVQHAEAAQQKTLLPMLREEAARGEVKLSLLALLEDRVLTSEGKPQLYGSQIRRNRETGAREFFPIADPINVDKRRAAVGLGPIEEYARLFGLHFQDGGDSKH